jgi:hypothetical protein
MAGRALAARPEPKKIKSLTGLLGYELTVGLAIDIPATAAGNPDILAAIADGEAITSDQASRLAYEGAAAAMGIGAGLAVGTGGLTRERVRQMRENAQAKQDDKSLRKAAKLTAAEIEASKEIKEIEPIEVSIASLEQNIRDQYYGTRPDELSVFVKKRQEYTEGITDEQVLQATQDFVFAQDDTGQFRPWKRTDKGLTRPLRRNHSRWFSRLTAQKTLGKSRHRSPDKNRSRSTPLGMKLKKLSGG